MAQVASDVMKAWFRRVWTEGEETAIDEMFPENGEAIGIGAEGVVRGPEAFKVFWNDIRSAFRTIRIDVTDCVDDGDRCYVRCCGTFGFGDKEVKLEGGGISRVDIANNLVLWSENVWDFLGLMQAMGALPADAFPRACAGETFTPSNSGTSG